jgi:putative ABC transport system substrate-binding protein
MRRRDFAIAGGAAIMWPLVAGAQQPGRRPTVGFLGSGTASTQKDVAAAFVQRLRELGWTQDRDFAIAYRWAEGRAERSRV